jgi:bacillopeptidase F
MPSSRLRRSEEKREKRTIVLAISGTVAILAFLGVFGVKFLEGFSLFMDKLRGATPQQQTQNLLILPPVLDPPIEATNSATITITGRGQADLTFILYVNEKEFKKTTVLSDETVSIQSVQLDDGENSISAKLSDDKGNLSDLSNVVNVTVKKEKPNLDVTSPNDNATIFGDKNIVTVAGKTNPENQIIVNDRFVVVRSDGSFEYNVTLSNGDNTLKIAATDDAGNQTTVERKVTYQR